MAISDQINKGIAKGFQVATVANALQPVLPTPLRNTLNSVFGLNTTPATGRKNIAGFLSAVNKYQGLARTNHFYVSIPTPPVVATLGGNDKVTSRELPFLCESAALPGVSLATSEVRRYGTGSIEKKPYAPIFTDQTFTFYGDNTGAVHKFFYSWLNGIIKYDERIPSGIMGKNNAFPFEVEYKNQYAVDITITCINEADQTVSEVVLQDAFPIFLGDVSLSWADNDTFVKIPITFTYYNWKLTTMNVNSALRNPAGNLSTVQRLIRAGTAIQTLATLRRPTGVADIINVIGNSRIALGGLF